MNKQEIDVRGWATKIRKLVTSKQLSQVDFAKSLGVSAATVSRWLSGKNEPTPQAYVALGNMADPPDDAYFWERAGVQLKHNDAGPLRRVLGSFQISASDANGLARQRMSMPVNKQQSFVAIPLLGVCAYADEVPPQDHVSLARADIEQMIVAPMSWCPQAHNLIAMHVCGESMFPTVQNDAVVVIDLSATEREHLNHELVVVSHRDLGLKIARLQHLGDCYVMVPANPLCMPIDISDASKWKLMGKVLWWISRDSISPTS